MPSQLSGSERGMNTVQEAREGIFDMQSEEVKTEKST